MQDEKQLYSQLKSGENGPIFGDIDMFSREQSIPKCKDTCFGRKFKKELERCIINEILRIIKEDFSIDSIEFTRESIEAIFVARK